MVGVWDAATAPTMVAMKRGLLKSAGLRYVKPGWGRILASPRDAGQMLKSAA
jgi:hypothetical protein